MVEVATKRKKAVPVTEAWRARVLEAYGLPLKVVESKAGPEVFIASADGKWLLSAGPLEGEPTKEQYMRAVRVARLLCDAANEKWTGEGGYEYGAFEGEKTPWGRQEEDWGRRGWTSFGEVGGKKMVAGARLSPLQGSGEGSTQTQGSRPGLSAAAPSGLDGSWQGEVGNDG